MEIDKFRNPLETEPPEQSPPAAENSCNLTLEGFSNALPTVQKLKTVDEGVQCDLGSHQWKQQEAELAEVERKYNEALKEVESLKIPGEHQTSAKVKKGAVASVGAPSETQVQIHVYMYSPLCLTCCRWSKSCEIRSKSCKMRLQHSVKKLSAVQLMLRQSEQRSECPARLLPTE